MESNGSSESGVSESGAAAQAETETLANRIAHVQRDIDACCAQLGALIHNHDVQVKALKERLTELANLKAGLCP